jgi:ADP-ribosyl-[dinitrogen reductase] hydrolase
MAKIKASEIDSKDVRTSKSHPLQVSWLTFAPGKQGLALGLRYMWRRSLAADVRVLVKAGTTRLVCLLESSEIDRLRITALPRLCEREGIAFTHFPIVDAGVPDRPKKAKALARSIAREVQRGGRVVVHCAGGLGRTGTIGGIVLRELGHTPLEALDDLEWARGPRCPETNEQIAYVASWKPGSKSGSTTIRP